GPRRDRPLYERVGARASHVPGGMVRAARHGAQPHSDRPAGRRPRAARGGGAPPTVRFVRRAAARRAFPARQPPVGVLFRDRRARVRRRASPAGERRGASAVRAPAARARMPRRVSPLFQPEADLPDVTSITKVAGPSLTRDTSIMAPNSPVWTGTPCPGGGGTNRPWGGGASPPPRAFSNPGRRPRERSAPRVN